MGGAYKLDGDFIAGFSRNADDIVFDPTGTDLQSTDVDGAIKEINSKSTWKTATYTGTTDTSGVMWLATDIQEIATKATAITIANTGFQYNIITEKVSHKTEPYTVGLRFGLTNGTPFSEASLTVVFHYCN